MSRTVLLTGATGFIGRRLAARLHARGDKLRCIVRSASRGEQLRSKFGADVIVCEITDAEALTQALTGCDLAYHLAAIYDVGVVNAKALEQTNVEGTRAFLAAVERSGVARAVHVSTTVALGPTAAGHEGPPFQEYDGPYPSVYHRTKAEAHRLAREAQARGLPVIIACPAFVYGPGDVGPGGRFLEDLLRKRVPALLLDPATFSYVHVDDVAVGLELIGERGRIGETYILSGEERTLNEFAGRAMRTAGGKLPLLRFPSLLAGLTGRVLDAVTRATGKRFAITREGVATTARDRYIHSHSATTAELGWRPGSLEAGLPETVKSIQSRITAP